MRMKRSVGSYYPSFFYMELNDVESVADGTLYESGTFIHEFIHFLQDLGLPYNIRLNLRYLSLFYDIRKSVQENGKLYMPFAWDDNSKLLNEQDDCIHGLRAGYMSEIDIIEKFNRPEETIVYREAFDPRLKRQREFRLFSYTETVAGCNGKYALGARDLLEYIAYKIENKHYPNDVEVPQMPYRTVDLLFEHYGLGFLPDCIKLNIAEVCLYNDHPMRFLIGNYLENEDFVCSAGNLTYGKLYNINLNTEFNTTDGVRETLWEKRNRRWNDFDLILTNEYRNFPGLTAWIKEVIKFAQGHWQNRFVFSDLFTMDSHVFRTAVARIIDEIGSPLIFNANRQMSFLGKRHAEQDDFIQLYVLQEFFEQIWNNQMQSGTVRHLCPIEDVCIENKMGRSEYDAGICRRCDDADADCPYARFLNAYNLRDVIVES